MFHKRSIGSGITFLSEHIPYVHSVSLGIWVTSGSVFDGDKTRGIAHFVEHMIFKGTHKRDAFAIVKEIDDVGGVLNAYTSKEYTHFYVKVLKEDLPLAVDIITDIFLNSTFPVDEIDREKRVVIQEVKMVEDSPEEYVHELAFERMWDSHPLGYSILGDDRTINGFHRDVLLEYVGTHHVRDNIMVGAVGNLEDTDLESLLSTALRDVAEGSHGKLLPPRFLPGSVVRERDIEQVHAVVSFPALNFSHPKRYAQFVLNTIIGGGMSSRLFQEIREKRGMAYNVYSYLNTFREAGVMGVYAGTEPDRVSELTAVLERELSRIAKEAVTDDEIRSAKGQIKGNVLLGLESMSARLGRMGKNEMYFGRQVSAEEIHKKIEAVTIDDVSEVAREVIDLDGASSVFLGPVTDSDLGAFGG
ncbi:MAG: insulinase family protein [Deltaproteobacteria bacterium]|nr:insulinase family protein [Candidatus Zymogenaceae bacterium]